MRSTFGTWGLLAIFASCLPAQTPAQIVDNYVSKADSLTFQLGQLIDAGYAQKYAPSLTPAINDFNQALASLKTLYGNSAAKDALAAKSAAMTASQAKLAAEQTRLLTGDCAAEGTIKSGNGQAISPIVINNSSQDLRYYWLDNQGKRSGGGVLKPGQEASLGTYTTHPFLFADPAGRCVRIMTFIGSGGSNRVSPLLAPTVGPYLAAIQK